MRSSTSDARRLAADGDTPADAEPRSVPPTPQFSDVQRVRDTDLFASLLVTLVPAVGVVALAVWWTAPSDPRAVAVLVGIVVVVACCLAVGYATRIVVTVDSDALTVHVEPFERRPLAISHAEITDYRVEPDTPTGHGIALGSGRRAWWLDSITYGVADGECVHVDRADGRPIHVGTPRADDLLQALEHAADDVTTHDVTSGDVTRDDVTADDATSGDTTTEDT